MEVRHRKWPRRETARAQQGRGYMEKKTLLKGKWVELGPLLGLADGREGRRKGALGSLS